MLKSEFPSGDDWFRGYRVRLDLAYLGFEKLYKCKKVIIPKKKKRNRKLTKKQKLKNKLKAKKRIKVEHCIGGIKRYRILTNKLRIKNFSLYDDILGACSGLWNFYLS